MDSPTPIDELPSFIKKNYSKIKPVNNKWLKHIFFLVLILLAILTLRLCEIQKDYERVKKALNVADFKNQTFKNEINQKGEKIAIQEQLILSKDEALKSNALEIEELKEFKRIKSKIQFTVNTKIDTVYIPFTEISDVDTIQKLLPKNFFRKFMYKEKEEWFKFSGYVENSGVTLFDVQIKNKFKLIIADKKVNIFSKPKPQITLINSNPYTDITSLNNIQIEYNEPFYKKELFWFLAGSITTIIIFK